MYDSSDYGVEHTERMRMAIEDRIKNLSIYNQRLLVVAIVDNKVVGMLETYGTNRISLLFVDSDYHRNGIATAMMNKVSGELKKRGYDKIVLNSSPYGLSFYEHYGFTIDDEEKNVDTPLEHYFAVGKFNDKMYGGIADGNQVIFTELPEF